jgi:uncharacterized protein DUF1631
MLQTAQTILLNECRQLMTKRMRTSLTGMLNEVDDNLMKMAQDKNGEMEETACYEAVRELRIKRTEIKLRFERRLINLFENEIRTAEETERPKSKDNDETLKYFFFNELGKAKSVSIEQSAGEVRKTCSQVLMDLDNNFSLLLDTGETINPLQPEIVFEAFREACCDIKSGDEVRLMLLNIFEERIGNELTGVYQDINKLLVTEKKREKVAKKEEKMAMEKSPESEKQSLLLKYEMITLIEKRLEGKEVPGFVRKFLLKNWRLFLENTYKEYTENSIAWNAARQTMDDLIQSVCTMSTLYDRQRQVQLLPSLLFRLLNGMKVISMDEMDIELFLKQLKSSQLASLNTENSQLFENLANEINDSISKYELHS